MCRFWDALKRALESRLSREVVDEYSDQECEYNRDSPPGIIIPLDSCGVDVDCSYCYELGKDGGVCQGFWYEHEDEEENEKYPKIAIQRLRDVVIPIDDDFLVDEDWWLGCKKLDIDFNSFDREPTSKIFMDEGLSAYVGKLVDDAERHIKAFEASIASGASD